MTDMLDTMYARWTDPEARPLFKGLLIDDDGYCCAQGDVLRVCGWSDEQLRDADQWDADKGVADALGISVAHAVLLRRVNDSKDGQPEKCLLAERVPEYGLELLGPMHAELFAFFRRLDGVTTTRWAAARDAARIAARDVARIAAWIAAGDAARHAAGAAAARIAARDASGAAARIASGDASGAAARISAWTLVVRDLIGQHGFTQDHYDTLTRPLRAAGVVVHPDDAEIVPDAQRGEGGHG